MIFKIKKRILHGNNRWYIAVYPDKEWIYNAHYMHSDLSIRENTWTGPGSNYTGLYKTREEARKVLKEFKK